MKHLIIGTAGHIDHGKTTLIQALTGRNTDRLKEEKERGISIELGFTYFDLQDNQRVGIIDVPGHEKFIRQMLAGVMGMDMVMLVVAADEGVMPQTREHIDIMTYLNIQQGIVVLNKIDMVDEEWLELVEEDLRESLSETFLRDAKIIKVSAKTGEGVDNLKNEIKNISDDLNERDVKNFPRLPLDRVFTLDGFGTVVTGTLLSGKFNVGDAVTIYPELIESKIRSIQVHGESKDEVFAGQRVAINLANVKKEDIHRGDVIAPVDRLVESERIDVKLSLLPHSPRALLDNTRHHFHTGTHESLCRVKLLDREVLSPGESCYAQLVMEKPVVAYYNDPFVLRFYSPVETIGGGQILDVRPKKHKSNDKNILNRLNIIEYGNEADRIELSFMDLEVPYMNLDELCRQFSLSKDKLLIQINVLINKNKLDVWEWQNTKYYASLQRINLIINEIKMYLDKYHKEYSFRIGISNEEFRKTFFKEVKTPIVNYIIQKLVSENIIKVEKGKISLKDFEVVFDENMKNILKNVEEYCISDKITVCKLEEIYESFLGKEVEQILEWMLATGKLIKIDDEMVMHENHYNKAKELLIQFITKNNEISLAEFRDLSGISRKQAEKLLDKFDKERVTIRKGDIRILV